MQMLIFSTVDLLAQNTGTVIFSSGSGNWTPPPNTVSITVECWGGGGGGGAARSNDRGGGGGGGGGYARATFAVVPGDAFAYTIGAAGSAGTTGSGGNGGATFLNSNQGQGQTIIRASGGEGGGVGNNSPGSGTGGAGGTTAGPTGSSTSNGTNPFISNGGNGAAGVTASSSGGGGGGSGSSANGGNAVTTTGGAGGADLGGNGADGRTTQGAGSAGSTYGGGGSGGYRTTDNQAGGAGAGGYMRITYVTCEPLTITCPSTANPYAADAGECDRTMSFSATSGGGCGSVSVAASVGGEPISFPYDFPVGTTTVVFTATDGVPSSATCSISVTVEDNQAPTIMCPGDQTVSADGSCAGTVGSWSAASSGDNCGTATVTQSPASSTALNGHNDFETVTLTANDGNGNTATCQFTVTLKDVTKPTANCQDVVVSLNAQGTGSTTAAAVNNNSVDNCDNTLSLSLDVTTFGCNDLGSNPVVLTVTDDAGNLEVCNATVTVVDEIDPVARCKDVTIYLDDAGNGSTTANAVNNNSSDNCSFTLTLDPTSFTADKLGANPVVLTVEDAAGNKDDCEANVHVRVATTNLYVSTGSRQYSDEVSFSATIKRGAIGVASPAADSARFFIGSQYMGNAKFVANGIDLLAELDACLLESVSGQMSPGTKNVTVVYTQKDPNYDVSEPGAVSLSITKEDLDTLIYSGFQYFTTPGPNACEGTVTLGAYVVDKDDASVNGDCRGDVRKATVRWSHGSVVGTQLGSDDPVGLVDPNDLTRGVATTDFTGSLNNNECSGGGKTWEVYMSNTTGSYYGGSSGPITVTLAKPGLDFVSGGGFLTMVQSSGQYAATTGSNMNFGFTMKWNNSGKNLQGQINVIYRRLVNGEWKVYQIKSNAINSMSIQTSGDYKIGYISTKATLQDITNPLAPVSLGGNLSLSMEVRDHQTVNNGSQDMIGVDLKGSNGQGLLFSSHWVAPNTAARTITGGQINVRNTNGNNNLVKPDEKGLNDATGVLQVVDRTDGLAGGNLPQDREESQILYTKPNPFMSNTVIGIKVAERSQVSVRILDANGALVHTLHEGNLERGEYSYILDGSGLNAGFYILQLQDGRSVQMQRVLLMR